MAPKKKSKKVKSLSAKGLTSKQAKNVKGGADLLPAVLTRGQVAMGDGSVRNLRSVKLQKV